VISSLSKLDFSFTAKKRTIWKTLDLNVRRHLELCARLLACAQRQFLVDKEWSLLDDPSAFLLRMARDEDGVAKSAPRDGDSLPSSHLADSPWIQTVVQPLVKNLPSETNTAFENQTDNLTQDSGAGGNSHQRNPLLDLYQISEGRAVLESKNLRPLLLLTSACAEAFPSGSCWASSARNNWSQILPDDALAADVMYVSYCAPVDMALVVQLVSAVLEASGGSTGDPETQVIALLCLIRLTEATAVCVYLNSEKEVSDIASAWRRVWAILFRPDLRYSASTGSCAEGSCGNLVIVLLTEMVQRACTDPELTFSRSVSLKQSSFLYHKQGQIWMLPAFGKSFEIKTTCVLELTSAFLE
jgi:hypothetical protein